MNGASQSRRRFDVDGRTVVAHVGPEGPGPVVVWLGGTPHTGALLAPHLQVAATRGLRFVSVARPGLGGSDRVRGRSVADAAADVLEIADRLGVERFAVMGYSGGGPHALGVGALAPDRISGIATFGSLAPLPAGDASWFDGMRDPGALLSARDGREARERWEKTAEFDPAQFTDDDYAALAGPLAALAEDVGRAQESDLGGGADDDVAFVVDWGVDLADITAPALLVHGTDDRVVPFSHAERLERLIPTASLEPQVGRGHVGVLRAWAAALDRLTA